MTVSKFLAILAGIRTAGPAVCIVTGIRYTQSRESSLFNAAG